MIDIANLKANKLNMEESSGFFHIRYINENILKIILATGPILWTFFLL